MARQADKKGLIFKIKRFSVHDGPGIRTSVFLKGCPLKCIWCHSPEGQGSDNSIWHDPTLCIYCGKCVKVCRNKALELTCDQDHKININRGLCKKSGNCVKNCPSKAMQFTGTTVTVPEIINEVEKDLQFYKNSGGGVTLTGGEPLYQPNFAAEILAECRKRKIHTAIETSLFCSKNTIDLVLNETDLFIVDIKLFNSTLHQYFTGQSNEIIKENFRFLAGKGKDIIVRVPMIQNITDTTDNLNAISRFVHETRPDISIEKIAYNPLAGNNYKKLGIPFLLS
jgi:pyruvate formate lyase activating enzyme